MIDKNRRVYITCVTPMSRLFFPQLAEKTQVVVNNVVLDKDLAFRMQIAVPKSFEGKSVNFVETEKSLLLALQNAVKTVAEKAFPLSDSQIAEGKQWSYPPGFVSPFKDGDTTVNSNGEPIENNLGHWLIRCKTTKAIAVTDGTLKAHPPIQDIAGKLYAGCYVRAAVSPFPWDVAGKKGVSFGLSQVTKVQEGESLDGAAPKPAAEVFGQYENPEADVPYRPDNSGLV